MPISVRGSEVAEITGRVIDEQGRPVAGAYVSIRYSLGGIGSAKSAEDGQFIVIFRGPVLETMYLYTSVEPIRDHEDESLIAPPFQFVGRGLPENKDFPGKQFFTGNNLKFDVGDVPIMYRFNDVHVRLTRGRRKLTVREWERLYVRLRDRRGRIVYEQSFAPRIEPQANVESSEMRIMLPEGEWSFDFQKYIYGDGQPYPKVLGRTPKFTIRGDSETTELCTELLDF